MSFDLDNRQFSPVSNSQNGRVKSDAIFSFAQNGQNFTASYKGEGVYDGHLIGTMTGPNEATILYHARAEGDLLQAGQAQATFSYDDNSCILIEMDWSWLTGDGSSGNSFYREIK